MKKILTHVKRITFTALNKLWQKLCRRLPLKNRVFFYTIRDNGKLLDNIRLVYEGIDCEKVVFAHKLPHNFKIKPRLYYYLLTSRVIVTDDYLRYLRAVKLRDGQKVLQLWHACGAFKMFGLDAPSRLTPQEERATHSQYTAVAVSSEKCRKPYAGAFGIPEEKCLPIGVARTDLLLDRAESERMSREVYADNPCLEGKKIYLYCPTFREDNGVICPFDPKIDWTRLDESLDDDELFVIRRHPHMKEEFFGGRLKHVVDLTPESTLKLIYVCDVLITDYSSVIFDAALLNKPMVFYCPDLKNYERSFYLKYPDELPGVAVMTATEILPAVRAAKENPPVERIESFKSGEISSCDGHSTERAVALVKSWLS